MDDIYAYMGIIIDRMMIIIISVCFINIILEGTMNIKVAKILILLGLIMLTSLHYASSSSLT